MLMIYLLSNVYFILWQCVIIFNDLSDRCVLKSKKFQLRELMKTYRIVFQRIFISIRLVSTEWIID